MDFSEKQKGHNAIIEKVCLMVHLLANLLQATSKSKNPNLLSNLLQHHKKAFKISVTQTKWRNFKKKSMNISYNCY